MPRFLGAGACALSALSQETIRQIQDRQRRDAMVELLTARSDMKITDTARHLLWSAGYKPEQVTRAMPEKISSLQEGLAWMIFQCYIDADNMITERVAEAWIRYQNMAGHLLKSFDSEIADNIANALDRAWKSKSGCAGRPECDCSRCLPPEPDQCVVCKRDDLDDEYDCRCDIMPFPEDEYGCDYCLKHCNINEY